MNLLPNQNTLRCLLERDGFYPAPEIELCIRGMLPRIVKSSAILNRIREQYYLLAQEAGVPQKRHLKVINVLVMLQLSLANPPNVFSPVKLVADNIKWVTYQQNGFQLDWPAIFYYNGLHVHSACRLLILRQLWTYFPRLVETDLSSAIEDFSEKNIREAFSFLRKQRNMTDPYLNDRVRSLMNILASGPKTSRELQDLLHVKRGTLLKKYLSPAQKQNLIGKTSRCASDPAQKYRLLEKP